ncbi:WD40 repeat domain-containing protein [Nocardia gamkensis]|uniref:WD40 repeat domain-containing protein n=1 Tax=Nocardia gamkensis TaxID=352869 RepID=UPI0033EC4399
MTMHGAHASWMHRHPVAVAVVLVITSVILGQIILKLIRGNPEPTAELVATQNVFGVVSTSIGPGGRVLPLSVTDGSTVRLAGVPVYAATAPVTEIVSSASGLLAVTDKSGTVSVVDSTQPKPPISQYRAPADATPVTAAISPDGRTLAIALSNGNVLITTGGIELQRLPATSGTAGALIFSPDGASLAIGNSLGVVTVWHFVTQDLPAARFPQSSGVTTLSFSPTGSQLVVGTANGQALLLDASSREQLRLLASTDLPSPVTAAAFSPDGKTLAVADKGSAALWSPPRGLGDAPTARLAAPGEIRSLTFSGDAQNLIVTDSSGTVQTWRIFTRGG